MSIAQQVQLRELTSRVSLIESSFRGAAETGNSRERLDNLEQTVSGILLELSRLSKALAPNEAGKDPQGEQWPISPTTKSAPSSALGSAVRSTAQTASSAATAKQR